jgi:PAS domain S-box-containing protein
MLMPTSQPLSEGPSLAQALFRESADALFLVDPDTDKLLDVNAVAVRLSGFERLPLLQLPASYLFRCPGQGGKERLQAASQKTAFFHSQEGYLLRTSRDGVWVPVNLSVSRLHVKPKTLALITARDIREQRETFQRLKRLEAELREQQVMLKNIITHTPCAVFWKDRTSSYLGCNERSARDLGLSSPEDVVGKTDYDMPFRRAEADFYRQCDGEVMESGQPLLNIEETQRRPDGSEATLLTSKVPLRNAAGEIVGVLGVYTDISERKRLEEQYRQAQKMEAVGRLAGGVAHDFNNLLCVINGYADVILAGMPASSPDREMIAEIKRAGERAAGLTRRLLAFSRKEVVSPRLLDLNTTVYEADRLLHRLIGEDIQLVSRLAPERCIVKADPGQLEQVLLNLAVNARDAMPRGGRLTIETRNLSKGAGEEGAGEAPRVLLSVSDTGHGMDEATRARIFEPFFTTKGRRGTGLGLATVYGIVTSAGGHIEVDSTPGQGTTFRISLPCSEKEMQHGPALELATDPEGRPGGPLGTETVLLAEDEEGVRALSRVVLRSCGYKVLEAGNGVEAVRVAAAHPGRIDLLVTDVVMPQLSGREAAERLQERFPELGVLFLSGYTDDEVVRHGILDDQVAFLQKPFTPSALAQKVRQVLDTRPRSEVPACSFASGARPQAGKSGVFASQGSLSGTDRSTRSPVVA